MSKKCVRCGYIKDESEFPVDEGNFDSLSPYCTVCEDRIKELVYEASVPKYKRFVRAIGRALLSFGMMFLISVLFVVTAPFDFFLAGLKRLWHNFDFMTDVAFEINLKINKLWRNS